MALTDRLIDARAVRQFVNSQSLAPELRQALESGKADLLEAAAMEHVEQRPDDVGFFVPLFNSLLRRKHKDEAELYLQFLLEAMAKRDSGDAAWVLHTAILAFWPDCAPARAYVLTRLRTRYAGSPSLDRLCAHFRVADAEQPLEAMEQVESWLLYDQGRGVCLATGEAGRVVDVNVGLDAVRVAFQGATGKPTSFRITEAHRMLERLDKEHFLMRKLDDAAELARIAESDPGEALRLLFTSINRPLSTSDIKQMFTGVVAEARWSSWWNRAKKDPRLTIGAGARPVCTWSGSAGAADAQVLGQFTSAPARAKLEIAQKHWARSAELAAAMATGLAAAARDALASEPALAAEICLSLEKTQHAAREDVSALLQGLLGREDAADVVAAVADKALRKRAMALVREQRADWPELYARLIRRESDSPIIASLYADLGAAEHAPLLQSVVRQTISQPVDAPRFFVWLCKEAPRREELRAFATGDLLQRLLGALDNKELKGHYPALRQLFDPGGVVDRCIEALDGAQAALILSILGRTGGLEDYRREQVNAYILKCHPHLRQEPAVETFWTTREARDAKSAEFEKLVKIDIPQNTEDMKRAKAHGDLRENFEYHAARARQEMLSSRAKTLHDQLQAARILEPSTVDPSAIVVGTRVVLAPAEGGAEPLTLTLLGPWDSDPATHVLSYTARAAEGLLGRTVGDMVQYDDRQYTVTGIGVWKNGA